MAGDLARAKTNLQTSANQMNQVHNLLVAAMPACDAARSSARMVLHDLTTKEASDIISLVEEACNYLHMSRGKAAEAAKRLQALAARTGT